MSGPGRYADIETPCVKRCVWDAVRGLCTGCGRTGAEIGDWVGMTPGARRAIMAALPARLRAAGLGPPEAD